MSERSKTPLENEVPKHRRKKERHRPWMIHGRFVGVNPHPGTYIGKVLEENRTWQFRGRYETERGCRSAIERFRSKTGLFHDGFEFCMSLNGNPVNA